MDKGDDIVVSGGELTAEGLRLDMAAPLEAEIPRGETAALGDIVPLVGEGPAHAVEHLLLREVAHGTFHNAPCAAGAQEDRVGGAEERLQPGLDGAVQLDEIRAAMPDHRPGHRLVGLGGDLDRSRNVETGWCAHERGGLKVSGTSRWGRVPVVRSGSRGPRPWEESPPFGRSPPAGLASAVRSTRVEVWGKGKRISGTIALSKRITLSIQFGKFRERGRAGKRELTGAAVGRGGPAAAGGEGGADAPAPPAPGPGRTFSESFRPDRPSGPAGALPGGAGPPEFRADPRAGLFLGVGAKGVARGGRVHLETAPCFRFPSRFPPGLARAPCPLGRRRGAGGCVGPHRGFLRPRLPGRPA